MCMDTSDNGQLFSYVHDYPVQQAFKEEYCNGKSHSSGMMASQTMTL